MGKRGSCLADPVAGTLVLRVLCLMPKDSLVLLAPYQHPPNPPLPSFLCPALLSAAVLQELQKDMKAEEGKAFTMKTMAKIKNKIEGWWVARA